MKLTDVIARLRAHETELRAFGLTGLSVFGSVARGEERRGSDVDLAAKFDPTAKFSLIDHCALEGRLEALLGVDVDLVKEPVRRKPRIQALIERDRAVAF